MDKEYVIDFEESDSGAVVTIEGVWAASGEEAIAKARTIFNAPTSWACIGLDRVKE